MHIEVPRPALAAAFSAVAGAVPTKSQSPICQNVKLVADKDGVTIIATNKDVGVRRRLSDGVIVKTPGELLIPFAKGSAIIRDADGDRLRIEVIEKRTYVGTHRSSFHLDTADPRDFPTFPEFDADAYQQVKAEALALLIKRTEFATDVESTRYALSGALVEFDENNKLTMVATDTRRLAVAEGLSVPVGKPVAAPGAVVPNKALDLIARALDGDAYAHIAFAKNAVHVRVGQTTVYALLVEGRFPGWRNVMPMERALTVRIEVVAGALHHAVRQASIVTSEESRGVDFAFSKGVLTLKSSAAEVGQSTVELPIAYEGDPLTITFDPRYVADFLKVLPPETSVTIGLTDSESAALFSTEDGYRYVVMPLSRDRGAS